MPDKDQLHRDQPGAPQADAPPLLATQGLSKDYPGIRALDNMNFELQAGEIHVLFGENGAGKSTLISLLAGANSPSEGHIYFKGAPVKLKSVHEARALGISAVFQEFSLIPQMTVAENLFLGAESTKLGFLRPGNQRKKAQEILTNLDFHLSPDTRVDQLTRAEQQMVEIAKAFRSDLSVLILDEPTASLTNHETEQLFKLVNRLKTQGVGIIYITHRMAEIREIGDRITVLRDGRYIDTVNAKNSTEDELVHLMTGRVVGQIFPPIDYNPADIILETRDLHSSDGSLNGASVKVHSGEIVGFAGLIGSGKSRLAQAMFGSVEISSGQIRYKDELITNVVTREMLERGMLYLPSDRRTDGLMMMRPAGENISLPALHKPPLSNGWILNRNAESTLVYTLADQLNLSPLRVNRLAGQFSGGNQQKLMLARSLTRDFNMIIFDEPTVGVDVGTRAAIYEFIAELCASNVAILLISSDLPEILNLTHRTYVFHRGKVQAELRGDEITETAVLSHFFEQDTA